jgi:hypothetical protein
MLRGFNGNCQIKGAIHHELISQVEGRELVDGNLEAAGSTQPPSTPKTSVTPSLRNSPSHSPVPEAKSTALLGALRLRRVLEF